MRPMAGPMVPWRVLWLLRLLMICGVPLYAAKSEYPPLAQFMETKTPYVHDPNMTPSGNAPVRPRSLWCSPACALSRHACEFGRRLQMHLQVAAARHCMVCFDTDHAYVAIFAKTHGICGSCEPPPPSFRRKRTSRSCRSCRNKWTSPTRRT